MPPLPYNYMLAKDIDWFFNTAERSFHVASAGSILPWLVNDDEWLGHLHHMVANLPDICSNQEIIYNTPLIEERMRRITRQWEESQIRPELVDSPKVSLEEFSIELSYLRSFQEMARKGFVSLDKWRIEDPFDDQFYWVCRPNRPIYIDGIGIPSLERLANPEILETAPETFSLYGTVDWGFGGRI